MKSTRIIAIAIIIVTVALAAVSFVLLPDTVTVQLSIGGNGNSTLPKPLAVALPTLLGLGGGVAGLLAKEAGGKNSKYLIISGVGLAVFALTLIVNLAGA